MSGPAWRTTTPSASHEVSESFLYPSFHSPVGVDDVFVDQETWDALPDDLKAIAEAAVANWSLHQWENHVPG